MSASVPTPEDDKIRGTKEYHHPDGTLRLEVCRYCAHDRVQDFGWEELGFDETLNTMLFAINLWCPDCLRDFSLTNVAGEVMSSFSQFMHNQLNYLKLELHKYAKTVHQDEMTEFNVWMGRFITLLGSNQIVPEDF